jgi:hypothetical protein
VLLSTLNPLPIPLFYQDEPRISLFDLLEQVASGGKKTQQKERKKEGRKERKKERKKEEK